MKITVVHRAPAKVAYLRYTGPFGEPLRRFWRGTVAPWLADNGLVDCPRYGVSLDDPRRTPPEKCRYDACVELPAGLTLPDAAETIIPGGRYASTLFRGPGAEIGPAWTAFLNGALAGARDEVDHTRHPYEYYPRGASFDSRTGAITCELCLPLADAAVSISRATPADAKTILALQKRAYESEARSYDDWSLPPLAQTLESMREEFASGTVLKAVIGEGSDARIVGSVRARLTAEGCQVGRLVVEPGWQGRGIGTLLMRAIEQAFPEAARFQLFTGSRSEGNIRLYERLGYQRTHDEVLSPAVTLTHLEKRR